MDRAEYHATARPDMPFKEHMAVIRASDAEQDRQIAEGDGWRATLDDLWLDNINLRLRIVNRKLRDAA